MRPGRSRGIRDFRENAQFHGRAYARRKVDVQCDRVFCEQAYRLGMKDAAFRQRGAARRTTVASACVDAPGRSDNSRPDTGAPCAAPA